MAAATITASVVTGGSNSAQTVAEELNSVATDFITQGVVGSITSGPPQTGAFAVNQDASPDMGVTVTSGRAYVSGTPSGQDAQVLNARMTSNYTSYTINANASGSTKYDWIYLQLSATNANNPSAAKDNVITLYTSRSTSNASDNGSPPTYGLLLAVVTVANGASSIVNGNITDKRVQASLSVQSAATTGWQTLQFPLTYSANNGNKEFQVTTPNDVRSTLSVGQKINITRSVTPNTQCMSFTAASSQYATKASPSGITFTGAFTCEAWIYLNSYTSTDGGIISRTDNSTAGFFFGTHNTGQIWIQYGASGAFTQFQTYQSVPLKRWVHVAGVVTSVSGKTGQIYINAVAVPTQNNIANATTLTQTGNLTIGTFAAPSSNYFDGYISEARVWSTNQTQANIQANMTKNLVGNETNLVALFTGSGNFNDSTSNANNLTANGGAIATQASNPYNSIEYGTIIAISYSNPTSTITIDTGDTCMIPNMTLNSPQYSTSRNPYGLPSNLTKYRRIVYVMAPQSGIGSTPTQVNGLSSTITIPTNISTVTILAYARDVISSGGPGYAHWQLWDGAVNSGTLLEETQPYCSVGSSTVPAHARLDYTPASGSHTYNIGLYISSNTVGTECATTYPAYLLIECDL